MTTILLVIVGILAIGLAVFSWRFENCDPVKHSKEDKEKTEENVQKTTEQS